MKRLFVFLLLFAGAWAQARPWTADDAGYELKFKDEEGELRAEGTWTLHTHLEAKILSDKGVQDFSIFRIAYNSKSHHVTEIKASVSYGREKSELDPANIEDRSVGSSVPGFDDVRVRFLPLPALRVGAEVSIDYTMEQFQPEIRGALTERFPITSHVLLKKARLKLRHPATVHMALHDPAKRLHYSDIPEKNGFLALVEAKDLPSTSVTSESHSLGPLGDIAWLEATSFGSFDEMGRNLGGEFERVLGQKLPAKLEALLGSKPKRALNPDEARERLHGLLDKIADKFRYFGDWRTVEGRFAPRDLKLIAETGYGDCKDFAVLATLAARQIGLQASVALVERGNGGSAFTDVPTVAHFNHAIARVELGDKAEAWVDATNRVPNLGLVPLDIAGRKALVLSPEPRLIEITQDGPDVSTQDLTIESDLSQPPTNIQKAVFKLRGFGAWEFQNYFFGYSERTLTESLLGWIGVRVSDALNPKVSFPKTSRVFPFENEIRIGVSELNALKRAGQILVVPVIVSDPTTRLLNVIADERFSDLFLAEKSRFSVTQELKSGTYKRVLGAPAPCAINSPWFDFRRKIAAEPVFRVIDDYVVKNSVLTRDEVKSPAFAELQKQLRDCVSNVSIAVE